MIYIVLVLWTFVSSKYYLAQQIPCTACDILQIFYDKDDLNSGLYEGTVRGRRLFTSSAIPHGQGTIYYFNNDKYHRVNYTGDWVDGTREGNGTTNFKDGSVYRGIFHHKCLFHSILRFSFLVKVSKKTKQNKNQLSFLFTFLIKKIPFFLISFGSSRILKKLNKNDSWLNGIIRTILLAWYWPF